MTDRDLLELAAKAAGIEIYWSSWYDCYYVTNDVAPSGLIMTDYSWRPLTDDGDAFRLAVKLGIGLAFLNRLLVITSTDHRHEDARDHGDNLAAATRRAIVKAAARLADSIPSQGTTT